MNRASVVEKVGLREDLQGVDKGLFFKDKIKFVETVIKFGIRRIQLGLFVSSNKVPQASDIDASFNYFAEYPNIIFTELVLNRREFERVLKCGAKHLSISILAVRTHQSKVIYKKAIIYL